MRALFYIGTGLIAVLGLTLITLGVAGKIERSPLSEETLSPITKNSPTLPPAPTLTVDQKAPEAGPSRTVTLEKSNSYVFKGVVTAESVGQAISTISKMSSLLSPSDTIYLVLDSPGGSVPDGADLIDFLKGVPQKVTTITIFSASMAFHIVESNPGQRFIVNNGTLMSHRASVEGMGGQLDGEFETRYKMMKRQIDVLDMEAATRMGLQLSEYKTKIQNELWVFGFDAKSEKVADEIVTLRCGKSMHGTYVVYYNTPFGKLEVVFDECPLVKAPLAIRMVDVAPQNRPYILKIFTELFSEQETFVQTMILNEHYKTIFP